MLSLKNLFTRKVPADSSTCHPLANSSLIDKRTLNVINFMLNTLIFFLFLYDYSTVQLISAMVIYAPKRKRRFA